MFPELLHTINKLTSSSISETRKGQLNLLTTYMQQKLEKKESINLVFICTHNSRRSQFSQIWAHALKEFYSINAIESFSAGTEVTALYPSVLSALEHSGFKTEIISNPDLSNLMYAIKIGSGIEPAFGFSKSLESTFNPSENFAAIMTCSSADKGCPFVPGCEIRISLPFEDPKAFDNTAQESEKYLERSLQIASELKYVFSQLHV